MKKSHWVQIILCLAIMALFVCGQQAQAQAQVQPKIMIHRIQHAKHARAGHVRSHSAVQPAPGFYPIYAGAAFMGPQDPSTDPPTDEWPCDPNWGTGYCDGTINYDWPLGDVSNGGGEGLWGGYLQYSIPWKGDPTDVFDNPPCFYNTTPPLVPVPPQYGTGSVIPYCTQLVMSYEDDTNDTSDELYQTIVVTQSQGTPAKTVDLMDTGIIDQGTNGDATFADTSVPYVNVIWLDALFGTLGQPTSCTNSKGKSIPCNNGMCLAANALVNYWGSSNLASGKTCYQPIEGAATVTITTYLGNPNVPTKALTTCGVGKNAPCSIKQSFTIFFTDDGLD
jgi:hypothetical protein